MEKRWRSLTNALAGLFCTSLNFLDESLTVSPQLSYQSNQPKPKEKCIYLQSTDQHKVMN